MVQMTSNGPVFGIPPDGILGEVRMFALTITGAVTKATLQTRGWAICDGTTASSQGVTEPTITATTPNLENKFIKASDNETSGTTGGSTSTGNPTAGIDAFDVLSPGGSFNLGTHGAHVHTGNEPPYYELVFFIKVRV